MLPVVYTAPGPPAFRAPRLPRRSYASSARASATA
jgi:hypothetical protein